MVLQDCTNSENVLVGSYGETYPGSHDANQVVNIKAEKLSGAQEEVDPAQIAVQEIKIEPEVSCKFLYNKYAEKPIVFLISIWLSVCAHASTPLCC
jgi:hypothetical protein